MIKHYLKGIFRIARMGLYTNYELQVLPTKKSSGHSGSTIYHEFKRMFLLKHFRFLKDWAIHTTKVNGRFYSISLEKQHKVDIMDCVAHLERKRLAREQ